MYYVRKIMITDLGCTVEIQIFVDRGILQNIWIFGNLQCFSKNIIIIHKKYNLYYIGFFIALTEISKDIKATAEEQNTYRVDI